MRQLIRLARQSRGKIVAGFAAVTASSLLSVAPWRVVRFLIDGILPGGRPSLVTGTAAILLAIFGAQALVRAASVYLLSSTGERVAADLRMDLYEHLHRQSIDFFVKRRIGELVSRLTNDVAAVRGLLTTDLASAFSDALVFCGALGLLLTTDWGLTLVMLCLVPVVAVAAVVMGRHVRKVTTAVQDELAGATNVVEETLAGMRLVQSFCRQDYEISRYRSAVERALAATVVRIRMASFFGPFSSFLFGAATSVVLWLGGRKVLAGNLTPGELIEFIGLTMVVAGAISRFSILWTRVQQAFGASRRLFEILDTEPTLKDLPSAIELGKALGQIEFQDVVFHYPDNRPRRPALDGVSFRVGAGETLALVGPSGAGKTTLLEMILRLYEPTSGRILLDAQDVGDVRLQSLRRQVALVPQETHLFDGTVRRNILYGRLDAGEEEIVAAARAANAHEFIRLLPDGYDTMVGERGAKLSGGERQRVAIARAFLADAKILLLDEPTSALDAESEGLVRSALELLMRNRTTIVAAHRLSTIRNVEKIAVLEAGRIVEFGSHAELSRRGGVYARLYRAQEMTNG